MMLDDRTIDELSGELGKAFGAFCRVLLAQCGGLGPVGPQPLMNAKDVTRITGLSTRTIYRAAREGELKSVRFGRRVMFEPEEVDRYRRIHQSDGETPYQT